VSRLRNLIFSKTITCKPERLRGSVRRYDGLPDLDGRNLGAS
jgi:hypothetical protein